MAKIFGQLESAQAENLSADPSNLPDGRTWYNTTTSLLKAYVGAATRVFVFRDSTDTLTNKTLTSPVLSGAGNNKVVITDGSGQLSAEAQLAITRGGTGQATVSAAFNALSPVTTKGDLVVGNGANSNTRLAAGGDGTVLTADSAQATGLKWSTPLTNPMDNQGQIIYGGVAGAATKLAAGSSGQLLQSNGAAAPTWVNPYANFGYIKFTNPTDFNGTSGSFVVPNHSSYATFTNGGLCIAPGTANDLGFRVASLPAGTYEVTFHATMLVQTCNATYVITDGSTFSPLYAPQNTSDYTTLTRISGIYTYGSTQTNIDYKVQVRRDSGSGTAYLTSGSQGWYMTISRVA